MTRNCSIRTVAFLFLLILYQQMGGLRMLSVCLVLPVRSRQLNGNRPTVAKSLFAATGFVAASSTDVKWS